MAGDKGLRLFQVQKRGNRDLVDIRAVETLPSAERIAQVLVISPAALIAAKVIAYHNRRGKPKSGTNWRDIALLLLKFPDLKHEQGPVAEQLTILGAAPAIFAVWHEFVHQEIAPEDDEAEF